LLGHFILDIVSVSAFYRWSSCLLHRPEFLQGDSDCPNALAVTTTSHQHSISQEEMRTVSTSSADGYAAYMAAEQAGTELLA
jgi:hypothetical protein